MVRIPGRDEYFEAQLRHQQHQQQFLSQRRNPMVSSPYTTNNPQSYGYAYQPQQQRVPTPPSPPSEELGKPSLPSISSLLGIADENQTAPQQQQQQQAQQQQLQQEQQQVMMTQSPQYHHEQLPSSVGPVLVSHQKMTLPPTPPLGPESLENAQSPSAISNHSMVSAQPYYMGQPANSMMDHRHSYSSSINSSITSSLSKRPSIVSQSSTSPYTASSPYVASPYGTSSTINSAGPYYQEPHMMGMYAQRPLPSNYPPPMTMPLTAGPSPSSTNPWQHHHYISASSAAAFPQSQDRYICQTCNKAFSRPSSLRIHSHSHTGEKPFKCSHTGCGKAFSVRSNMKRHERGCVVS
ncbi:hypothetical protein EG328_002957 [Venturia inaequalis]|uniref:C2H2-type domain-containing protein n=1 Tax=Venturia inaequalis TaxID=5025 RepID=A0A8H3UUM9_VENIN|nr:hypothetical protein EG328_002957 [Venturia inaequalis]KAE9994113.1 hypothetical protein EG327_001185 [Venturia inaequalis]